MTALPPVGPEALPGAVRAEGPQAVKSYESALGFERLLLSKLLTEALPEESQGEGEGEEGGGLSGPQAVEMPEALAGAISSAGGVGLAADLYRSTAAALGGTGQSAAAAVPGTATPTEA